MRGLTISLALTALVACTPPQGSQPSPASGTNAAADKSCLPSDVIEHPFVKGWRGVRPLCDAGKLGPGAAEIGFVSKATVEADGDVWPLTIPHGFVGCTSATEFPDAPRDWVFIHKVVEWFETPDGRRYALGQFAWGKYGMRDLHEIWLVDPGVLAFAKERGKPPPPRGYRIAPYALSERANCPEN